MFTEPLDKEARRLDLRVIAVEPTMPEAEPADQVTAAFGL